ncbi:MAG: hypothetical protein ACKOJF_23545, partial [Planctomycetaceae bacterium]
TLPPHRFRGPALAALLDELLNAPQVAARCQEVAGRLAGHDGLAAACDELEKAWAEHHRQRT